MKTISRYSNKYNSFIDSMYIEELCDTNEFTEFVEMYQKFGHHCNFYGYANNKKLDSELLIFLTYIDIDNTEELTKAKELIDIITL